MSKLASLCTAALLLLSFQASADTSYHIGNSLTYDMYTGGLQQIAQSFGVPLTPGYHVRVSESLVYMVNNPTDVTLYSPSAWPTALPSQQWNFVAMEPYLDPTTPSTLQTDIDAVGTFMGVTPQTSTPPPVFLIYEAWPNQIDTAGNYDAYWNQTVPNSLTQRTLLARQYFDALLQHLTAQYGSAVTIRVIPVGDVLARINQLIVAGQFQGASNINDFYRDTYHMGAAGRFVAAATAFATMYGRKPTGAPFIPAQQPTDGTVNLTSNVAAELEEIIWSVVTANAARTGVSPLALSPGALFFQPTTVATTGLAQAVIITNRTSAAVSLDAISVSPGYTQSNTCGSSLAANAQCTVSVIFAPTVSGTHSGTLIITAAGLAYPVALSGSAPVSSTINASAASATVGQPITLTWSSSPGVTCQAQSDSASSPWTGSVAPAGAKTLTESAAGSVSYSLRCSAGGMPDVAVDTSVSWSWPPVDGSFSANPTAITTGQTTTLTWSSSGATTCNGTGGGASDGWSGMKSVNGTQTLTESTATAASAGTLTFTVACTSNVSGLSKSTSVSVVQNAAVAQSAPPASGGGGAFDIASLLASSAALLYRRRFRPVPLER